MKHLYLSDGTIVTNLSHIELDDLSINIPKAISLFVPEKCKITSSEPRIIVETIDSEVVCDSSIEVKAGGTFTILMESSEEYLEQHIIKCEFESETIQFQIDQQYVDITDRLVVLLNNYGIQVDSDWMRCFYESDIHELNIDFVLKDRKMSEFLMEFMSLVGLRGTYKTLFAAVSYFGYKDIVWFEEHWINNEDGVTRRYTTITTEWMDARLTQEGYTKIGDMTMFYSLDMLDPDEPYDEGGLPNYVKRNISFDDLFAKLILLRQILNKWFIPWDTYIVDIVGELHAVAGLQKKWWINNDMFINQDEEQRYGFVDIEYDNGIEDEYGLYHLHLKEEKMLVDTNLYTVLADETLRLNQDDTAHIRDTLIKIEKLGIDELVDLKDFDIITKFQRKDVAILLPKIKLNGITEEEIPNFVNGFKIRLLKILSPTQEEIVYTSKMMSYTELISNMRFGITQLGTYEFSIIIFDAWGYAKVFPIRFVVTKEDINVDFWLMRPSYLYLNKDFIERTLEFDSTHETLAKDGISVVDAVSTQKYPTKWDVNNPDEITNIVINRYYTTKVQNLKMLLPIRRYGSIPLIRQTYMPIDEYWAPYNLLMINCLKRGAKISLKEFTHHAYTTITYLNGLQFLHDLIEESKKLDSPFRYYDWDVQLLNATERERLWENENMNANEMLMVYSRFKSFSLDKVIFRIEVGDDVITNDDNVLGSLYWYSYQVTWYDRPLTLYAKNENSKTLIVDKESNIQIYHNYMYPALGTDALIRMNTIYNTTKTELGRLVLYDRVLTLYDKPLFLYTNSDFKDPNEDGVTWQSLSLSQKYLWLYNQTLLEEAKSGKVVVDYHIKFRFGSTWFYSLREYGKPIMVEQPDGTFEQEFETPPLDFEQLRLMFDQYASGFTNELGLPQEVLDNLDVYFHDSNFIIRARNGYDIEIMHMNIGHKIAQNRIGSISKLWKVVSGTSFQCMSVVIAMPNEEVKFQNCDVSWKITEHFSKQQQFASEGYVMRWIPSMYGLYDVEMTATDKVTGSELKCLKPGCILIE